LGDLEGKTGTLCSGQHTALRTHSQRTVELVALNEEGISLVQEKDIIDGNFVGELSTGYVWDIISEVYDREYAGSGEVGCWILMRRNEETYAGRETGRTWALDEVLRGHLERRVVVDSDCNGGHAWMVVTRGEG